MNDGTAPNGMYRLLDKQVTRQPDAICFMVDNLSVSYEALARSAEKIAGILFELGVRQGDRVGILLPTADAWFFVFWGIQRLGAVGVPLPPGTGSEEIANVFRLTEVKVCFAVSRFQVNEFESLFEALRPALPSLTHLIIDGAVSETDFVVDFRRALSAPSAFTSKMIPNTGPSDLYILMSTSGTTGVPKVIPKHYGSSEKWLVDYLEDGVLDTNDILFCTMPPFHMLSLSFMLMSVIVGIPAVYQSAYDPEEMLAAIGRLRTTVILMSATHAKMLLGSPGFETADLSSVQSVLFSGEFLPDEIAAEFYQKRSFHVVNIVGSTEVSAYLQWDSQRDNGLSVSVLTPISCAEVKLFDEDGEPCKVGSKAEIFVSHDDILTEYYRNPEASRLSIVTSASGKNWFKTGDLAVPRHDGRYQFAGRLKRIVKRGAVLIYPEEIECFLMTHPDIQAAAVLTEQDELTGESMKAFIELRPGTSLPVIDIVRYCQGRLANHKIPEKFVIMDELPKETGKIQLKKLLKA